jgi:hypothetical protein
MDEDDFSLKPPSTTVQFGQSFEVALRNNTPGNSTCLQVEGGPGNPKLALSSKGGFVKSAACGEYRADHFTDRPAKHYENMKLRFTAPRAPRDVCEAHYTLSAQSGGQSAKVAVTATKRGGCGCTAFTSVPAWKATVSFAYSGSATASDSESTELVKVSHTGALSSALSSSGGTQWSGKKATGVVKIVDLDQESFSSGTVDRTDWTSSRSPDGAAVLLTIDPLKCTYSFSAAITVEAEQKHGTVTSPVQIDVLSSGTADRPLPAGGGLKISGSLDINDDGNGLAEYGNAAGKLEDLIGNHLGSHQGHVSWSISPASP